MFIIQYFTKKPNPNIRKSEPDCSGTPNNCFYPIQVNETVVWEVIVDVVGSLMGPLPDDILLNVNRLLFLVISFLGFIILVYLIKTNDRNPPWFLTQHKGIRYINKKIPVYVNVLYYSVNDRITP